MNEPVPPELIGRIQSDEFTEDVLSAGITRLTSSLSKSDPVADAVMALLVRIANTWTSIHSLSRHSDPHVRERCLQDVGALFRVTFEALIQLRFILHDSTMRRERAQLYLDFEIVERMKTSTAVLRHDSNLAKVLRSSPKRAAGEQRLQSDFARVADRFQKRKSRPDGLLRVSSVRKQWYQGTLRDLAIETGLEAQYDVWIGMYHGCIHSSIGSSRSGPFMDLEHTSFWASQVSAYALVAALDYARVTLDGDEGAWLKAWTEGPLGDLPDEIAERMLATRQQ